MQISAALLPRTPLYGGWSTDFVFGFELPLRAFASRAKDGRKVISNSAPFSSSAAAPDFVSDLASSQLVAKTGCPG